MEHENSESPRDSDTSKEHVRASAAELYRQITPLRRQDVCSKIIVAQIIALLVVGYIPLLFPIAILTTLGVISVCVTTLTGPIYTKQLNYAQGGLEKWGVGNKIAALLLLILFVGGFGFLTYWLYFRP